MIKYYNNVRVRVVRTFFLNGVHYTTILRSGEEITVETKELTDTRSENTIIQTAEKLVVTTEELEVEMTSEDITITADTDTIDETVTLNAVKDIVKFNVIAVSNNGKEINLGLVDELENSAQVKKMKLDIEAIQRCLEGKQKRHKGFSFKMEIK